MNLMWRWERFRLGGDEIVVLLRDKCGYILSGDGPVHGRTEIEDIGALVKRFSSHLFGGDVIGGSLNSGLGGSDSAALAEVDYFYSAGFADEDIVRLDVAMDDSALVHRFQCRGNHSEDE